MLDQGTAGGLQPLISETGGMRSRRAHFPCRRLVVAELVIHFMNCSPWVLFGDHPFTAMPALVQYGVRTGKAGSQAAGNCYTS